MRVLTLTQPWASMVAFGAKKFETRSWRTRYRGPLVIHSALKFPREASVLCHMDLYRRAIRGHLPGGLPLGQLLAIVDLTEIYDTQTAIGKGHVVGEEILFGNYNSGRFAFKLENVREIPEVIRIKGSLGIWTLPPAVEQQVSAYLAAS